LGQGAGQSLSKGTKMSATFNPAKRNRNIGTPKQGAGQSNKLVIPELAASDRTWKERLNPHLRILRNIGGRDILFIVEKNTGGCVHACSVDDIAHILRSLPASDWAGLHTFVLRQSSRKQRQLAGAWGRLFYFADLGVSARKAISEGPAIFLEAVDCTTDISWSTSLQPDDYAELERLRADGHVIENIGNKHVISLTEESVRSTQLYRTLLHEIGHWFDWLQKVEQPAARGDSFDELIDNYFRRPSAEREAFAHRYAAEARLRLESRDVLPFARLDEQK
jgi:hypothetical protein